MTQKEICYWWRNAYIYYAHIVLNVTQKEIANSIGVSHTYIHQLIRTIEIRMRRSPHLIKCIDDLIRKGVSKQYAIFSIYQFHTLATTK